MWTYDAWPWSNGRTYLNFAENPVGTATGFTREAWQRLQRIRAGVDPAGVFVANHTVPPAAAISAESGMVSA